MDGYICKYFIGWIQEYNNRRIFLSVRQNAGDKEEEEGCMWQTYCLFMKRYKNQHCAARSGLPHDDEASTYNFSCESSASKFSSPLSLWLLAVYENWTWIKRWRQGRPRGEGLGKRLHPQGRYAKLSPGSQPRTQAHRGGRVHVAWVWGYLAPCSQVGMAPSVQG